MPKKIFVFSFIYYYLKTSRVTQTTVSSFSPQLQINRPASSGDYDVTAAYDVTNSKASRDSTEITVNCFYMFN